MRKLLVLLPLAALIFAAFAGCARDVEEDIELIKELLLNSYFTGEGSEKVADDESNNPDQGAGWETLMSPMPADSPPFVKWVRKLESFNRVDSVEIDGDSAFAFITANLHGTIHVYNDSTLQDTTIYTREINDLTYREVVVRWSKEHKRWYIDKLTPLEIKTLDPEHPVKIKEIHVTSKISGEDFTITDPSAFYGRDEVPLFNPADTVTVTVMVENLNEADSGWVYLHHGRHFRKLKPVAHRKPFEKEDTWTFTGTWLVAEDGINFTPTVRHAAIDLIYWETLWGDEAAEYSAYAIGMPYVIAKPDEVLPDDNEKEE